MQHGFLILAHRDPQLCLRLIRHLRRLDGEVWVHVDARSDLEAFMPQALEAEGGVTFLRSRQAVNWGGFNMVQATLDLLHAMQPHGYDRYTLLSGDTYPIKGPEETARYFAKDTCFLSGLGGPPSAEKQRRLNEVYAPDTRLGRLRGGQAWSALAAADLPDLAALPGVLAGRPDFLRRVQYRCGSQWWSLPGAVVETLLDFVAHDPEFVAHLRFSAVPDEAFFQSAFATAGLQPLAWRDPPVFDLWDRQPKPFLFDALEQLPLLQAARQPFGRKFTSAAPELLQALDQAWD